MAEGATATPVRHLSRLPFLVAPSEAGRGPRAGGAWADRYVGKRGGIDPRSGPGSDNVGPPPGREAVLDGLARGEDHVVVFLKDDDF